MNFCRCSFTKDLQIVPNLERDTAQIIVNQLLTSCPCTCSRYNQSLQPFNNHKRIQNYQHTKNHDFLYEVLQFLCRVSCCSDICCTVTCSFGMSLSSRLRWLFHRSRWLCHQPQVLDWLLGFVEANGERGMVPAFCTVVAVVVCRKS